jgi:hypothetical protein
MDDPSAEDALAEIKALLDDGMAMWPGASGPAPCESSCMRKYVIMGIQGSGKGTHAKMLAADFDLEHVAVGDIFRWNVQHHTKLGAQVKRTMTAGLLVGDDLVEVEVLSVIKEASSSASLRSTATSTAAEAATEAQQSGTRRTSQTASPGLHRVSAADTTEKNSLPCLPTPTAQSTTRHRMD